jgi:two-component system sensor kinase FixL
MSGRAEEDGSAAEAVEQAAELERAQEQLRESEELYRHVVELSSLLPWTADAEGRVTAVGKRWREWTGTPPQRALGMNWLEFVHPDDAEALLHAWTQALWTGRGFRREWRMRRPDGSYRWCKARAAKRTEDDYGGSERVWYGTLEDVQERHETEQAYRRVQAELAHVSRLSAMGAMASAIAHDLNQPLTAIAQYVRGCRRMLEQDADADRAGLTEGLEGADRNTVRAADIVRRVREFVTRGTLETRRESLEAMVQEACRFAMADPCAAGATCRVRVDPEHMVFADRVQIRQVLVNLIRNAVAAMEGCRRREIVIWSEPAQPGYYELAVSDTGPGISAAVAAHMFDALYTTREEGMGVGLSISRTIIEAHGGAIWADSSPGEGATIRFTLPVAPARNGPVPEAI